MGEDVRTVEEWMQAASERLARAFHETYERLASDYGYVTRTESRVGWEQLDENLRGLMKETVREVVLEWWPTQEGLT